MAEDSQDETPRMTRREFLKKGAVTLTLLQLAPLLAACDKMEKMVRRHESRFAERISDQPFLVYLANQDQRLTTEELRGEPEPTRSVNVRREPYLREGNEVGQGVANEPEKTFIAFKVLGSQTGANEYWIDPKTNEKFGVWYQGLEIPNLEGGEDLEGYTSSAYVVNLGPVTVEPSESP